MSNSTINGFDLLNPLSTKSAEAQGGEAAQSTCVLSLSQDSLPQGLRDAAHHGEA